ncbi:hypothetical protein C5167_014703 [Papaver somniferum]|uniref:Uncharacterized protein n=1 Tax=Papaver somniferum TaxID=3469 RepID=A0A4Y7J706_PAPSO|nr:hypothetical protein C5167_014703 [Papaver somniferum]
MVEVLLLFELRGIRIEKPDQDFIIWRNCMKRDFTINPLMLDPYANVFYDHVGGMEDSNEAKVWTVIPTEYICFFSVQCHTRHLMEMNYTLAYGYAEKPLLGYFGSHYLLSWINFWRLTGHAVRAYAWYSKYLDQVLMRKGEAESQGVTM